MLWDDSALYIGAALEDDALFANETLHDSIVYHDNNFEVWAARCALDDTLVRRRCRTLNRAASSSCLRSSKARSASSVLNPLEAGGCTQ